MTLEEYVKENSEFSMEDFDVLELENLRQEVEAVNQGCVILDGVLTRKAMPDYSKLALNEK